MTTDLATRDPHEKLSKSFLTGLDWCERESWYDMWMKRPWLPKESVAFGAAVDEGLQLIITAMASGQIPDMDRALEAAARRVIDAGVDLDFDEVRFAIEAFPAIKLDWAYATVQHEIELEIEGIGRVNAHPDIILGDNSVWDIKTANRKKGKNDAKVSYKELAFYGFLREHETGKKVPRVGYLTWPRPHGPWQKLEEPLTEDMKRKAYVIARDESRRLALDAAVQASRETPINVIYTGGPAWPGKCADCAYSPAFGGPCEIAEVTA